MAFVDNRGSRLFWDSQGEGDPVLLVMGAAYSSAMWYPAIPALAAHHRVIWFDNRGIGKSTPTKKASIEDMASDAVAVLDAAGVDRAHVFGVSLGGVVVIELALSNPDRIGSLLLGCTGILDDVKPRAPKWLNGLAYLPAALRFSIVPAAYGSACPPDRAAADRAVLKAERPTRAGLIQQQDALRAYSTSVRDVAQLTMPSLVLHGTEDKAVKYEHGVELAATLPDSRLVTYEGSGHNFMVAMGEQANQDVLAFLAEHPLSKVAQ